MPRSEEQLEQIRRGKKLISRNAAFELCPQNGIHVTSIARKLFYSVLLQPRITENIAKRHNAVLMPLPETMRKFLSTNGDNFSQGDSMIVSRIYEEALLIVVVASNIFHYPKKKQKIIDGVFRIIKTGKNNRP